jgi:hypothetical protein
VKLLRLVVVRLSPKQEQWERFRATDGHISLGTVASLSADNETKLLMCADILLETLPPVSGGGFVQVPPDARVALEESLERIVDLIALAGQARRHTSSPVPHVLLLPECDSERVWLADKRSLGGAAGATSCAQTDCRFDIDDATLGSLTDRWDGAGLLADVVSLPESMSQFRELNRFFERAFARSSSHLSEPLSAFLADAPMKFSREEIERWTVGLRHPSIHADRSRPAARPRDVFFAAPRMVAAGYDVLLNKARWHSPDTARRSVWRPWSGSYDAEGRDIFLTAGRAARLAFIPYDQFGVYPLAMDVLLPTAPIRGAWPAEVGGRASADEENLPES